MSLPLIAKDHTLAWLPVVEQRFPKPLQPILACIMQFRLIPKFGRF
jgi:hypothetical protein